MRMIILNYNYIFGLKYSNKIIDQNPKSNFILEYHFKHILLFNFILHEGLHATILDVDD